MTHCSINTTRARGRGGEEWKQTSSTVNYDDTQRHCVVTVRDPRRNVLQR